jgi:thiol-disulfide isomerase/thioredoxin
MRRAVLLVLFSCSAPDAPPTPQPAPATPTTSSRPPKLVKAPAGGRVAEAVVAEQATADGDLIVVYVGAAWCEPCVAFHDALVAGNFNHDLTGVRFLEYDLDRDKARLEADGYTSRYVPLFAIPGQDGRASGRALQGGIKGPGAADNILQRLRPLLAEARQSPG